MTVQGTSGDPFSFASFEQEYQSFGSSLLNLTPSQVVKAYNDWVAKQRSTMASQETAQRGRKNKSTQDGIQECNEALANERAKSWAQIQAASSNGGSASQDDRWCPMCNRQGHRIQTCYKFRDTVLDDKIKFVMEKGLCFRCLDSGHLARDCKAQAVCSECGRRHHKLLHDFSRVRAVEKQENPAEQQSSVNRIFVEPKSSVKSNLMVLGNNVNAVDASSSEKQEPRPRAHLGILPVIVAGAYKEAKTFAVMDSGTDKSLITEKLFNSLDAKAETRELFIETGDGEIEELGQQRWARIFVQSRDRLKIVPIDVVTVPKIPVSLRDTTELVNSRDYLSDVEPIKEDDGEVELLIGADCTEAMWSLEEKRGSFKEPFARRTTLGWTILGPDQVTSKYSSSTTRSTVSNAVEIQGIVVDSTLTEQKEPRTATEKDSEQASIVSTPSEGQQESDEPRTNEVVASMPPTQQKREQASNEENSSLQSSSQETAQASESSSENRDQVVIKEPFYARNRERPSEAAENEAIELSSTEDEPVEENVDTVVAKSSQVSKKQSEQVIPARKFSAETVAEPSSTENESRQRSKSSVNAVFEPVAAAKEVVVEEKREIKSRAPGRASGITVNGTLSDSFKENRVKKQVCEINDKETLSSKLASSPNGSVKSSPRRRRRRKRLKKLKNGSSSSLQTKATRENEKENSQRNKPSVESRQESFNKSVKELIDRVQRVIDRRLESLKERKSSSTYRNRPKNRNRASRPVESDFGRPPDPVRMTQIVTSSYRLFKEDQLKQERERELAGARHALPTSRQ